MAKKLVRSKKERMFLGVLGGIAEYLEVDPTLVRLVFVVLFVLNPGAMLILYFLAALVMPEEEGEEEKEVSERLREVVDEAEKKTKEVFFQRGNGEDAGLNTCDHRSPAYSLVAVPAGFHLAAGWKNAPCYSAPYYRSNTPG